MSKKYVIKVKKILQARKEFFLLAGIILAGLILRLVNIGTEPYWSDEILSLEIAKHYIGNLSGLWNYLQLVEVHPPLYYYLVQIWGGWFGFGEAAIRSLSLIFSLGVIYLTYWAGLVLFNNKRIGLLAAFFTAILPMQIEFGQEARPYAIYSFLGILSLILLAKYFKAKTSKHKFWLISAFTLASIFGLYLHYSYMLIIIPLSIYWLIKLIMDKSGKEFLWWLGSMTIIFLGFYLWLPTLIFKSFLMDSVVPGQRVVYENRPFVFFEEAVNSLLWTTKTVPSIIEIITALLVKMMFAGLAAMIILKKKEWLKKHKETLIYLGSIFVMSIVLFLIFPSSTKYTTLLYRHILFDSSILALLLGAMFIQIKNIRWRIICLSLFLISLMTFQINILGDDSIYDINHRFKLVVEHINNHYQNGDLLLSARSFTRPQFNYYLKKDIPSFISALPMQIILPDFMSSRDTLGIVENETQLRSFSIDWPGLSKKMNYLLKKNKAKRVWVIGDSRTYIIRKWFVFNGWKVAFEPIGDMFPLTLYVKSPLKNGSELN